MVSSHSRDLDHLHHFFQQDQLDLVGLVHLEALVHLVGLVPHRIQALLFHLDHQEVQEERILEQKKTTQI